MESVIELYKETYSVSQVIEKTGMNRKAITKILKDANVYEGLSGPNYLAKKAENHKKVMLEKYGVENISQIRQNGIVKDNSIEYSKVSFDEKLKEYKDKVYRYSKKIIYSKKSKLVDIPDTCFYTGITFADCLQERVNPNDPYKRTIDHKHPIILCYTEGWSIEEAGGPDNVTFVLRYINNLKSNTTHESFLAIAEQIKPHLERCNENIQNAHR